jgi:hypothetical protein
MGDPFDLRPGVPKSRRKSTTFDKFSLLFGTDTSKAMPKNTSGKVKQLLHAKLAKKHSR